MSFWEKRALIRLSAADGKNLHSLQAEAFGCWGLFCQKRIRVPCGEESDSDSTLTFLKKKLLAGALGSSGDATTEW